VTKSMSLPTNGRPSVLILTGNLGDGHRQAAFAMAETAKRLYPGAKIRVVDVMEGGHPRLHQLGQFLYMLWITKLPWLYGFLFRQTKNDTLLSRFLRRLPLSSPGRLKRLLADADPSVIVSTFPAASAAVTRLKRRQFTAAPVITVITDHTYHSYWLHPETDLYIVGSEHVRQALRRWPVSDRKIAVTGIPVRSAFARQQEQRSLRMKLGLQPDLPTVMIMGGGGGLIGGDWAKLLRAPGLLQRPMQIVIVCGRNDKLKERLTRDMQGYPHPVMVTGYVDYVNELMAASDLLISKPGGLTSSEALASELPMLLYRPLPGQEHDNAAYLTGIGAAVQAKSPEEFAAHLTRLLEEPQLLAQMKTCAKLYSRREAAELAVREIMETVAHAPTESKPLSRRVYAKA
jgi:processive 1,2-diacylglycerol beta-glucosyltransferase